MKFKRIIITYKSEVYQRSSNERHPDIYIGFIDSDGDWRPKNESQKNEVPYSAEDIAEWYGETDFQDWYEEDAEGMPNAVKKFWEKHF